MHGWQYKKKDARKHTAHDIIHFERSRRNTLTMRALTGAQTRKLEIQSWETRCGHARASLSHRCWPLGSPSYTRWLTFQLFEDHRVKNLHLLNFHCSSLSGAPSASASSLHPPSSPFLSQYFSITSSPVTVNISLSTRRLCHLSIFTYFRRLRCKYGCPQVLPMDVGAVSGHFATHCREPHSRVRLSLRELLYR